jgi:lipoyl(octanoyl) transferase
MFVDLGVMGYAEAQALQRQVVTARKAGLVPDVLLLCEHPPVITLGRNARREHVLAPQRVLEQMGVELFETDRGGDVTFHGPGQLVGYPILNLAAIRRDVVWYVRQLEEALLRATSVFGISTARVQGKTGIWAAPPGQQEEKLAAIGIHISRWVTSHGFALNVSTDLRFFDLIVPCGIRDRRPTSLEKLLGRAVPRQEVLEQIVPAFEEAFGLRMRPASPAELAAALEPRAALAPAV